MLLLPREPESALLRHRKVWIVDVFGGCQFSCDISFRRTPTSAVHREIELTDVFEEAPAPAAAAPAEPSTSSSSSSGRSRRGSRSSRSGGRSGPKSREQRQADMAAAADADTTR